MSEYIQNSLTWWENRSSDEKQVAYMSAAITTAALGGLYLWHAMGRKDVIPCDETLPFALIEAIISKSRMRKSMNNQLGLLLDQYCSEKSGLYIEYNGFLSNHASHAIVALYRIGCSKDTIVSYMKDEYLPRLQTKTQYKKDFVLRFGVKPLPLFQNVDIPINKYIYFFKGRRENFYGLYAKFKHELETNQLYETNVARLVAKFFPLFSSGMAGSAFHALIQLGYGMSSNHNETTLEGLAYLVHSYLQFDTQLQNSQDMMDDAEFTVNSGTNSSSSLDLQPSLLDVLKNMQKDEHFPESPISRLKQYANTPEIKNMIGVGFYIRSMTILSRYGQAELTQKFLPLLPQLSNLFAIDSNNNNKNNNKENNKSELGRKNSLTNLAGQGDEVDSSLVMRRIRKYILTNVLAVWTYCNNSKYNDFFIFHVVTGGWSLVEILEKTKLYESNRHATLNALRQFFYALGAVYAMEGNPNINCPQWLRKTINNIDNNTNNNSNSNSNGIYIKAAPNVRSNKALSHERDLLKRQIATMVDELKPKSDFDSAIMGGVSDAVSEASQMMINNDMNYFRFDKNRFDVNKQNLKDTKPLWKDEHVYKGLQIILESVDDGIIDLRLARDAIAKLRYDFDFNAVIAPNYVKIAARVKRMFK